MGKKAINRNSKDPFKIIVALNKAVVDVVKIGETQATKLIKTMNDANNHVEQLAHWLFGVTVHQISNAKYEVDLDNVTLKEYVNKRQNCAIMQSLEAADVPTNPENNTGVLLQFNQSLTLHTEAAQE